MRRTEAREAVRMAVFLNLLRRCASFRLLRVAIGPFWPNSAQKFRMRRRWTDASRPFFRAKPPLGCLRARRSISPVEHVDDHVTIRAKKFPRATFVCETTQGPA